MLNITNKIFNLPSKKFALKNQGFTLAEILITLVVIGVIAAITVPILMENHRKDETVARLFKIQGMFQSAVNYAIIAQGPVKTWNISDRDSAVLSTIFSYLKPHLSILKDCGLDKTGCWSPTATVTLKGRTAEAARNGRIGNNSYNVTLNDGTNFSFDIWFSSSYVGVNETPPIFYIYVDTNGNKNPNAFGKDTFIFVLKKNGSVVPAGADNNSPHCKKSDNTTYGGFDCAAKIFREKKITYY